MDPDVRKARVKNMFLMNMTTGEVEAYLKGEETVLIPVGSCEQHGSHCPLGTDSFITQEISKRIAQKLNIVVAPMIPVGLSDQHLPWPGTLSLRVDTIRHILLDYVDSLFHHGFRKVILHYFHTKNKIAVDAAAWEIKKHYGEKLNVMAVNSFASWGICSKQIMGPEHDELWVAHGGEGETSCLMALGYNVEPSKIPGRLENREFLEKSRSLEAYSIVHNLKKYTIEGTWGDASLASSEIGEKIFESVSSHLAELIPNQWDK